MTHGSAHTADVGWPAALLMTVVVAAAPALVYTRAVATLRSRTTGRWRTSRTLAFSGGALAAAIALTPVVGLVTASAAGAHMAQHVLLGMVAPLGLVLGAPVTLALAVSPVRVRRRATAVLASGPVDVLAHPLTAACLHVGGLYALYLTPLHDLALEQPAVGALVLAHLGLAGCLYTWALVGPERAARRPGFGWRVGVLVGASAAHGYLAKHLHARAEHRAAGGPHTAAELAEAARWMYSAGDVVEVALAVVLFTGWYRRAGRRAARRADARTA